MREFFYKHKKSRFHDLNPLVKFFVCAAVVVAALLFRDPVVLLGLFLLTQFIVYEAKVSRGWFFYMKIGLWIGLFIICFNLILNQYGETTLFEAHLGIPLFETVRITLDSLLFGALMALRLAVVISAFAILSLTISPEEMMWIMSKFKIPTKSVFLTSLSTRFVPALLGDIETLTDVQKARGAKLKGFRGKGPVLMPLLSNSLERSVAVAEAMEARGFGGRMNFYYDKD